MILGDFVGLTPRSTAGKGVAALDPTLLPQSEGTALRGVLPPELESFKLAQLPCVLSLLIAAGDCEGLTAGLPSGLATAILGSSIVASAMNCGGTMQEELAGTPLVTSFSELGLSGIP